MFIFDSFCLDRLQRQSHQKIFITDGKGGVARAKAVQGREREEVYYRVQEPTATGQGDGMRRPLGHLITGAGREEVLRNGGEEEEEEEVVFTRDNRGGSEARSVQGMMFLCVDGLSWKPAKRN